jgi:hypothetical protein
VALLIRASARAMHPPSSASTISAGRSDAPRDAPSPLRREGRWTNDGSQRVRDETIDHRRGGGGGGAAALFVTRARLAGAVRMPTQRAGWSRWIKRPAFLNGKDRSTNARRRLRGLRLCRVGVGDGENSCTSTSRPKKPSRFPTLGVAVSSLREK